MKPISPVLPHSDLPEVIYAKDQPQYLPLPAVHVPFDGASPTNAKWRSVISHWKLNFGERLRVLFHGDLWLEQITFGDRLQPQRPAVEEPLWK
jgi:hypothetical protein